MVNLDGVCVRSKTEVQMLFSSRLVLELDRIGVPATGEGRQEWLALKMGVTPRRAKDWIDGNGLPGGVNMLRLAMLLNLSLDELYLSGRYSVGEERGRYVVTRRDQRFVQLLEATEHLSDEELGVLVSILRKKSVSD